MKLYVIGDFQHLPENEVVCLMNECDACMLAERAPIVGEIYSTLSENMQVRITEVEHLGKVVSAILLPGPDLS